MTSRNTVGKTWWGQAWLCAFDQCESNSRLSKGKSYFLNNQVEFRGFDPRTRWIEAFVHSSVYAPCVVTLALKPIELNQWNLLLDHLSQDRLLLPRLLDGELPIEVAGLCHELGIELFPNSLKDIESSCTCSDRGPLCKHVSALIYFLADMIDANPFVIFSLRGFDLINALKDKGISLEDSVKERPLTVSELLESIRALKESDSDQPLSLQDLPLTPLKPLGESIFSLLPLTIASSEEKNFRDWYRELLNRNKAKLEALNLARLQRQEELEDSQSCEITPLDEVLGRDNFNDPLKLSLNSETLCFQWTSKYDYQDQYLQAFWFLTVKELRQLSPVAQAFRTIFDLAARFYQAGAFVPAIMQSPFGRNYLPQVWILPSLQLESTQKIFAEFARAVESDIEQLFEYCFSELRLIERVYLLLVGALTILHGMLSAQRDEKDIFKLLISHSIDEKIQAPEGVGEALVQYFRVLNLGRVYPWQPLIKLTSLKDGTVSVNFGIYLRKPSAKPVMLKSLLTNTQYANDRLSVLNVIRTLAQLYCPFEQWLKEETSLKIEKKELAAFLFEITPYLTLLGVTVSLPERLKHFLSPKLILQASCEGQSGSKVLDLESLADFHWEVVLGDKSVNLDQFQAFLEHKGEMLFVEDRYVYMDPLEIQKIQQKLEDSSQLTSSQKLQALLGGSYEGIEVNLSRTLKEKLKAISRTPNFEVPKSLKATLRPYQLRGFSWLLKNFQLGLGALIADDMGLGKTLQVIAALTYLKEKGEFNQKKVLVVVPTTLLINWQRELERFSPTLNVALYHGPQRKVPKQFDILLTSYGTARMDVERLKTQKFRLLVLDEAQAVKNSYSSQTQTLRFLSVQQVIAMSGTPIENRLLEYWSIFSLVQPSLFGSKEEFKRRFVRPIEVNRDPLAIEQFRKMTAPFLLRRLKTDKSIIDDLPEKLTQDCYVSLRTEQAILYERFLKQVLEQIEQAKKEAEQNQEDPRWAQKGLILKLLTGLKQICNSVSQFQHSESIYPDSGKGDLLIEQVERSLEAGRKVLIFSQYKEMGERIQTWLKSTLNIEALFLHGGVALKKRSEMVDRFQNDSQTQVMILSLKAAGTGLNLTQASTVIHYDLWWNPAVEEQATDRAYRIGQKRDVIVYRFITRGTFEERINEMLSNKKELAGLTVSLGETWIGDLSFEELQSVFKLDSIA